jgi:protein TonB
MLIMHVGALFLQLQTHSEIKETVSRAPMRVHVLDEKQFRKQIVQSDESTDHSVRKGAYLSDKNRSFDRQTRSRRVDIFQSAGKGNATFDRMASRGAGRKSSQGAKKGLKNLKLSDLGASKKEMDPFAHAAREYAAARKGVKSGSLASRGISSTNDHVEDIPLGDLTNLNTVEYKYYGFYHRIRQKLEQFWGRSIQQKAKELFKEGRRVASDEELLTSLRVVMDSAGKIINVEVIGSSGVREFDDAAIESFNEAGPFPFPPKDLIVDGRVVIEWGFLVQS